MLFNDQRDNEADQSQSLAEGGAHDEDGEHAALDLRLTGHSTRSTQSRQAYLERRHVRAQEPVKAAASPAQEALP